MSARVTKRTSVSRRDFIRGMGAFGLVTAAAMGLAACSSGSSGSGNATANTSQASNESTAADPANSGSQATSSSEAGKTLVAYFSGQGHTRRVAEELANDLGADLFEIVPVNAYSDADLNYNDDSSRVVQEYQNGDQRDIELTQNAPDNFADYDNVFVGYPIWWGDSAWAMHRFVSQNDFTGKTVTPFCTSFSSGLGSSGSNLADLAGTGDWQKGQRFAQNVDLSDVRSWAQELSA